MKLAIYSLKNDGELVTTMEEINNPYFIDDCLVFDKGSVSKMDDGYILLNDNENPPNLLDDAKKLDKKDTLTVEKSQKQLNEDKDQRIAALEDALIAILDLIP